MSSSLQETTHQDLGLLSRIHTFLIRWYTSYFLTRYYSETPLKHRLFLWLDRARLHTGQEYYVLHVTEQLTPVEMLLPIMCLHLVASRCCICALWIWAVHFWAMNCPFVACKVIRAFECDSAADNITAIPDFRSPWTRTMLGL